PCDESCGREIGCCYKRAIDHDAGHPLALIHELRTTTMTGKNLMKTFLAILASALLLGAAYADAPSPASGMNASSDATRDLAVEKHIKDLHGKLQITPAQETQWAAVAKAMRDSAIETDKAIDKREAIVGSGTAIDNLNAYGDIAQAHVDGVKRLA